MKIYNSEPIKDSEHLTKREIIELLKAEGDLQKNLFKRARQVRKLAGVDRVKLQGVIELSNFCPDSQGDRDKEALYAQHIFRIAKQIKRAQIETVVLRSIGDCDYDGILETVIPGLQGELGLKVLLSLGEKPREAYQKYAELGAGSYLLKFEASNPILYQRVTGKSLRKRLRCIHLLQQLEYKIGTGNLVGLTSQSLENIAEDILLTIEIQPDIVCCSPAADLSQHVNLTLNTIAIYRLALQKAQIIAASSLERIEPDGQLKGLNAGANVLNINFTPTKFGDQCAIYAQPRFMGILEHMVDTVKRAQLRI